MADTTTARAASPAALPPFPARLKRVSAKHRLSYLGQPLAIVQGLPGDGAELFPEDLRALAHALLQIADDCTEKRCAQANHRTGDAWSIGYPRVAAVIIAAGRAA